MHISNKTKLFITNYNEVVYNENKLVTVKKKDTYKNFYDMNPFKILFNKVLSLKQSQKDKIVDILWQDLEMKIYGGKEKAISVLGLK